MKTEQKKSALCAALVLCLLAGLAVSANIQQTSMPYVFPLTPENEEWKELKTTDEMYAAYQIPEETLEQMSTKALVNTVLDDTFLTQFTVYNTGIDAMRMHREGLNIYPEMQSRADYYEVLAGLYEKAPVLTEADNDSREVPSEEYFYLQNLEILIAADIYEHGQDAQARAGREQMDEVIRAANQRILSARAAEGDFYSAWDNGFTWFYVNLPEEAVMDDYTESLLAQLADAENYYN